MEINNENMSTYLMRIASHLIVNCSYLDDLSLYNGKAGIVVFFAHLARATSKTIYDKFAGKIIDELYAELHSELPINLKDGLCGIGWMMEYLLQNKFLDGSSDILLDLDQKIMEVDPTYILDKSIETGATGILFYVLTRLFSSARNERPFRDEYLQRWYKQCLLEIETHTSMYYLADKFVSWYGHNEVSFTINKFLPNVLLSSCPMEDEEFIYLPLGLRNGCAGIGLKNLLI